MKHQFLLLGLAFLMLTACSNGTSFGVGQKEDNFGSSVVRNNKVDIIWLVDDSSSMRQHQTKLSNEIPAMVTKLNELKMDYRMVVTTTSVGPSFAGGKYFGSPKVLDASTPGLADILKSRLVRGEGGSDREQGFLSLINILADTFLVTDGAGFHREESLLLINVLSDEDDQTDGSRDSLVQALKTTLNTFKKPFRPGVGGWVVNFIGVTSTQCQNAFGQSPIGYRYMDLVNLSGGKSFPICTGTLKQAVEGLQARVMEIITDYPLSSVPDLATVKVFKNGVQIPRSSANGWDYIPSLNLIRFYGTAVPSSDEPIKVSFTPASAS